MSVDQYLYVDEELHILTGEDAARALRERSDASYLDPREGVVRVPKQRWQQAQRYERDTWMVANAEATDDRNTAHSDGFESYAVLEGRKFEHAVELGCGPFTNLRLIAGHCTIAHCSLLDPLIDDYLKHPHCTYDHHGLRIGEKRLNAILGSTPPGRALRRVFRAVAPGILTHRIPVEALLPMPIEEMPARSAYDLVVILNVLEHCYDATAIFDRILAILKPGGVFVFHDKLFTPAEAAEDVRTRFDAGHPLRVGGGVIESFLEKNFTPLFSRHGTVEDGFEDHDLSRDGIYFIGERKA
ncbi:MAG TPA: methyltransferase domain-containing protein [Thermoanaerobaculia bacterium]|jgi:SAM-dependent methyltransferase|nr:methyltransferase domain-containing protein [Thermoanaerobaculia bacterium]